MNTYLPIPKSPAPWDKLANFDREIIFYQQSQLECDPKRMFKAKLFWRNMLRKLSRLVRKT